MAVVLDNRACVDDTLVRRVLEATELPSARILLVLSQKGELKCGDGGPYPGLTVHRQPFRFLTWLRAMFAEFPAGWKHAAILFREALA